MTIMNRKKRIISLAFAAAMAAATFLPRVQLADAAYQAAVTGNTVHITAIQADFPSVAKTAAVSHDIIGVENEDGDLIDIKGRGVTNNAVGAASTDAANLWYVSRVKGPLDITLVNMPAGKYRMVSSACQAGGNDHHTVAGVVGGGAPAIGGNWAASHGNNGVNSAAIAKQMLISETANYKAWGWFTVEAGVVFDQPTYSETDTEVTVTGRCTQTRAGEAIGGREVSVYVSTTRTWPAAPTATLRTNAAGQYTYNYQRWGSDEKVGLKLVFPDDHSADTVIYPGGARQSTGTTTPATAAWTLTGPSLTTVDGNWLYQATYAGTGSPPTTLRGRWTNTATGTSTLSNVNFNSDTKIVSTQLRKTDAGRFSVALALGDIDASTRLATETALTSNAEEARTASVYATSAEHLALYRVAPGAWRAVCGLKGGLKGTITFTATSPDGKETTLAKVTTEGNKNADVFAETGEHSSPGTTLGYKFRGANGAVMAEKSFKQT
ncbi:MAG: hypothetical protein LBJ95_04635 [Oscillospiraceae bacterium]|jgi:hypothetical protein|nr:hypothetical protein [Oscillospiraceae bacterium]